MIEEKDDNMKRFNLQEQIIEPLMKSGWTVKQDNKDKKIFYLTSPNGEFSSAVQFATRIVTSQGRQTKSMLLRIQPPSFDLISNRKTVLIGWSPEHSVFVAWNADLHSKHGKNPMISCYTDVLKKAADEGLAWGTRKNKQHAKIEYYVSFTSDFLPEYLLSLEEIFNSESVIEDAFVGDQVQSEEEDVVQDPSLFEEEEVDGTSTGLVGEIDSNEFSERKERIRTFKQKVRDHKFRKKLLNAYNSTCAISGTTIRQVLQAAHIVGVADGGDDSIANGVLLSANHHLLFDAGLLNIEEDFTVTVDPVLKEEIWYKELQEERNGKLLLPPDEKNWPSPTYLKKRKDFQQNYSKMKR